jgi:hypothetical protein
LRAVRRSCFRLLQTSGVWACSQAARKAELPDRRVRHSAAIGRPHRSSVSKANRRFD